MKKKKKLKNGCYLCYVICKEPVAYFFNKYIMMNSFSVMVSWDILMILYLQLIINLFFFWNRLKIKLLWIRKYHIHLNNSVPMNLFNFDTVLTRVVKAVHKPDSDYAFGLHCYAWFHMEALPLQRVASAAYRWSNVTKLLFSDL